MLTLIRNWWAGVKKRMAAPVLTLERETIVYLAGGDEYRVRFDDIQRIDAYPNMVEPNREWGVVYTGARGKIIVLESTDNFIEVFDAALAHLGLDGPVARDSMTSMRNYDGKNQMKRIIYQRNVNGPTISDA